MTADLVRRRLVEIDDALRALPSDAFAERHVLNTEQDALRSELRALLGAELAAASDDWAERSGRKGSHSVDDGEQAAAGVHVTRGFTSEGQG